MLVVLFLGATQLITLGVLGEYIGRIYDQTRSRPRYLALEEQEADRPRWRVSVRNTQAVTNVSPHEVPEVAH